MRGTPLAPKGAKPSACAGCSLHERGHGFVNPEGPTNAPILLMGEAPGYEEAALGRPFIGAAGSMLERILRRNRLNRAQFRIGNVLSCVPPGLKLEKMPWQYTAIDHCATHRDKLLNEGHPVVMALGGTALRTLLGLHGRERIRVEEFHGTVHDDPEGRFQIVPSFHTSYLQRGAHNLIGTVSFDLQVALEVARGQWTPQPIERIIDPPVEWVRAWVEMLEAAVRHDADAVGLASDVETPDKASGKPENELTPDDVSYQIIRHNFACHPDQGVTIPEHESYRPYLARLYALKCRHYWWNGYGYDWARIAVAYPGTLAPLLQLDMMIAAHILQSDVPLGLGFWAPFYSRFGAWKYRSATDPEDYACIDGPQTYRTGTGIIGDLIQQGQWRAFQEDCHDLYHTALKPATDVGILIDRPELARFHEDLAAKQLTKLTEMQQYVPESLRPLTHETGDAPVEGILHPEARTHTLKGLLKKDAPDPIKAQLYATAIRVERTVSRTIQVCRACGATEISKKHRCKDANGKPDVSRTAVIALEDRPVTRWFWQEPFNPDSPKQMLAYIKARGHKPGRTKDTKEDSADRETLIRLAKSTGDPFYQVNLDYRAVKKIDATYAVPTMRRVDREVAEGREPRIHPIVTFRPSMGRLSYISPNITNVVADKDNRKNLAGGFRRCVVAAPGCRLLEVDYAGIEPHEVGWFMRDPTYLRLARLGSHAYITSHILKRPADLTWSDADLAAYFAEIKAKEKLPYDKCKRTNNGLNYGLTPYGMVNTFPDIYKDLADAEKMQRLIFDLFPTMPVWHAALRKQAYDAGCLGGPGEVLRGVDNACYKPDWKGPSPWAHPFQYRHWFWSVLAYKPITEAQRLRREKARKPCVEINGRWFAVDFGDDSKRCIAFYPQSTAAGVLKRSIRALFANPDHPSYIGDAYYGRTPLRAPIHDSLLLEIPDRVWDRVCERVFREMLRPIVEQPLPLEWGRGPYLTVPVDAKTGKNWLETEPVTVPGLEELGLTESDYFGEEEMDEEDASEMKVVA